MSSEETHSSNSHNPISPCGIKVVITFFTFHLLLVVIPAWAYFQYDLVATQMHLEEPRELADEAVVQANRAIGLANAIWVIPLNVVAIVGLAWRRKASNNGSTATHSMQHTSSPPTWAFTASYMLLGVSIYWPIQYLCSRSTYSSAGIDHVPLRGSDVVTLSVVLMLSIWSAYFLASYYQTSGNGTPATKGIQKHRNYDSTNNSNEIDPLLSIGFE